MFLGVALLLALVSPWSLIERGHSAVYPVNLAAGRYVSICVEQKDIDLSLEMLDPSGQVVARAGANYYGQECLRAISRTAGTHQLRIVAPADSSGRGKWRICRMVNRPAKSTDEQALEAQAVFWEALMKEGKPDLTLREEALTGFSSALELAVAGGDIRLQAEVLTHRADELHRLGRHQQADVAYSEAIRRWQAAADPVGLFTTQLDYQKLLGRLGRRSAFYSQPQEEARWKGLGDLRAEAYVARRRCQRWRSQRRFVESEREGNRAIGICKALDDLDCEGRSIEAMTNLYLEMNRHAEWVSACRRRLEIAESRHDIRGTAAAQANLGIALNFVGQSEESLAVLTRARDTNLAAGDTTAADANALEMAQSLFALNRISESVVVIEEALARERAIEKQFADPLWKANGLVVGLMNIHIAALTLQAQADGSVESANLAFHNLETTKSRFVSPRERPLRAPDADTVFLSYWMGGPGWLWVVTAEERRLFRLPDMKVAAEVTSLLTDLASGLPGWKAKAQRLSRILLGPAAPWLGKRRLVVSVHAGLSTLPFAVLPDPRAGFEDRLLGDDHEIVYVPSLLAPDSIQASYGSLSKKITVLADPVFDPTDPRLSHKPVVAEGNVDLRAATRAATGSGTLSRLPFSYREAQAIAALAGSNTLTFTGFDANRERLLQGEAFQNRILHIATHGLYNPERPDYSGLVLSLFDSKGMPQSGFVRLVDLLDRSISCQLIVLSACQTALGRTTLNETTVSLTSTLLRAGARSVISSAWKIDDEATARFVEYFYEGLLKQNLAAPAALSAAQRRLRANPRWSHPYYWAAMMFHGEWEWQATPSGSDTGQ